MNKNFLIPVIFCAGLFHTATAQQKALVALHYEMEHRHCYDVRGCVPFSAADFYSEKGGGRQLLSTVADSAGQVHFVSEQTFHPVFVLNNQNKQNHVEGTLKVHFIGAEEFSVNDIQLNLNEGRPELHYTASVSQSKAYNVVVLRSMNGAPFTAVQTQVLSATSATEYTFREQEKISGFVSYQLKVQSAKGDLEASSSFYSGSFNTLSVYPNPCTDRIKVAQEMNEKIEEYSIADALGKIVFEGAGNTLTSEGLKVSDLLPGIYTLKLKCQGDNTYKAGSFVKK